MATDGVKPQGSNGMCEIALKARIEALERENAALRGERKL